MKGQSTARSHYAVIDHFRHKPNSRIERRVLNVYHGLEVDARQNATSRVISPTSKRQIGMRGAKSHRWHSRAPEASSTVLPILPGRGPGTSRIRVSGYPLLAGRPLDHIGEHYRNAQCDRRIATIRHTTYLVNACVMVEIRYS